MKDRSVDPAFLRGVTQRRLSRRDMLRISGLSAATMAFAAACGVKGQGTPAVTAAPDFWADKTKHGTLNFANWPLYMDTDNKPELTKFTQETGITVNYQEVIEDDPSWFAKVQPQLAAHQSIGYDLQVITNGWEFTQFKQLGYLAPLDHTKLTNFTANADPVYTQSSYDPGNVFSVPWASGMTGIAYDPDKTGRPITKLADLWDPAFKGKVGMMSDAQEIANFGLLKLGIDPKSSTPADWQRAADELQRQKDLGVVRKYYDQGYADALSNGEIWVTMAWSGDILQLNISNGTNLQFVVPEEGGTLWTDNMTIPVTADNPVDAMMLLDFFYRPDIAASLAEYIGYVTPVPGAKALIQKDADDADNADDRDYFETLVDSPLVFPDEATLAKLYRYVEFATSDLHQQFTAVFEPITLT
ncbi:MAG TPA: spermidine/putrescine ABC transporter substrate-binding protein [Micromonosporaceae bacterium]|jgi:spermidine/putrescine transport system substrate-binding protein